MAHHLMVLNPSKRGARRRKPSAKQLAARRKFAAAARARSAARATKPRKRRARRAAPVVYRNPSPIMRKRRRSRRRIRPAAWFARRRVRRNPILPRGFVSSHLQPAAIGAAGALLNDMAVGWLVSRLPTAFQAMEVRHIVKAITAVGLGALASKGRIANNRVIRAGTVGAMTCIFHDALRGQAQKFIPGVPLGEYLAEMLGPWPGYGVPGVTREAPMLAEYIDGSPTSVQYLQSQGVVS